MRRRDAGCCDTSLGVGRFGAQKRCTCKPVCLLGQLGGCHPEARATQKLLLSKFVIWKATQTLPVWLRLRNQARHEASSRTEESFQLLDSTQASVRSQGGPGAGLALNTCQIVPRALVPPPSLSLCAPAGVANYSILVATTAQHAHSPKGAFEARTLC